ncbi:hypothetical protein [Lacticaseibacillus sp. GG6-2]
MKTFIVVAFSLLLSGCASQQPASKPSAPASSSHTQKRHAVSVSGMLYKIQDKVVFISGTKVANLRSAAELQTFFKDGIRISQGEYLNANTPLSIFVLAPTPKHNQNFALAKITVNEPNAQTLRARPAVVDLEDTQNLPLLRDYQLTIK